MSESYDIPRFISDVEGAFALLGGEKSKATYDWLITSAERERINGIIDQFIENSDYPEVVSSLEWLQDVIKGQK